MNRSEIKAGRSRGLSWRSIWRVCARSISDKSVQSVAQSGERAAGAVAGDKAVGPTPALGQDFGAGGDFVVVGAERIFELARGRCAGPGRRFRG